MPEVVAIMDTGVLCCWLEVPGRSTAGSGANLWNNSRANQEVDKIIRVNGTLILPTSVIIETANHIAQSSHSRAAKARQLFERIMASIDGRQPWKQFEESGRLWTREWYEKAQKSWPAYVERGMGLADYSILTIAKYFNEIGSEVHTLTTEEKLRQEVGFLKAPDQIGKRRRRREYPSQ